MKKTAVSLLAQLKKFKKRPPTPTKEFEVAAKRAGAVKGVLKRGRH